MHSIRKSFEETFGKSADALGMALLYDVAHNIAKLEEHVVEGRASEGLCAQEGRDEGFRQGKEGNAEGVQGASGSR